MVDCAVVVHSLLTLNLPSLAQHFYETLVRIQGIIFNIYKMNSNVKIKECVPIIDIKRNQNLDKKQLTKLSKDFSESLIVNGLVYIKNYNIDEEIFENLLCESKIFFKQNEEYKMKYAIEKSPSHSGYVSLNEKGLYKDEISERKYEAFDISIETPLDENEKNKGNIFNGLNVWPEISSFKEISLKYFKEMQSLSEYILTLFEIYFGLKSGFFKEKMNVPTSQLRHIHYIENNATAVEDDMNMGAHTDYELFTLLYQTEEGLQTENRKGQWIDVPPLDNTLVINIGDLLEVLTGGILKSNVHKVRNLNKERFSFPFFSSLNFNEKVFPILDKNKFPNTDESYKEIIAGEHVVKQITQDFYYLRKNKDVTERVNEYEDTVKKENK